MSSKTILLSVNLYIKHRNKNYWYQKNLQPNILFSHLVNISSLGIDKLYSSSALADLLCSDLQLKLEQELLWSLPSTVYTHPLPDLSIWGHFLMVLYLRNLNLRSACATKRGNSHYNPFLVFRADFFLCNSDWLKYDNNLSNQAQVS